MVLKRALPSAGVLPQAGLGLSSVDEQGLSTTVGRLRSPVTSDGRGSLPAPMSDRLPALRPPLNAVFAFGTVLKGAMCVG